jgi:hypothetical protein
MKRINSDLFLEIVNDMTCIHNQMMQKDYYAAGSNFNRLQHAIVDIYLKLKKKEEGDYDEDEEQEEVQEQDKCSTKCQKKKSESQCLRCEC